MRSLIAALAALLAGGCIYTDSVKEALNLKDECSQDSDCAPNQLCDHSGVKRCRQRCGGASDNAACLPNGECFLDHCTADVGTPCSADDQWCGGGECINVSASDTTTSQYCTMSCILHGCPNGFMCVHDQCRRPL
jgi:hypothetical protein